MEIPKQIHLNKVAQVNCIYYVCVCMHNNYIFGHVGPSMVLDTV